MKTDDDKARRAALRVGLKAIKSRQRTHVPNLDNFGEFMLIDPMTNWLVAGGRFDMTAADVLDYLRERSEAGGSEKEKQTPTRKASRRRVVSGRRAG